MLSIIVPVYNVEKYLSKCIDSIIAQSYTDFELLLIDDGSTDDSSKICDTYMNIDNRIKVVHIENGGVCNARNYGLNIAKGEIIGFVDADDYLDEFFYEKLINVMYEKNADCVVGSNNFVNENGDCLYSRVSPDVEFTFNSLSDKKIYFNKYLLNEKLSFAVWLRIYKSSIINKYNIRFCDICNNYAEDFGFVLNYEYYSNKSVYMSYIGYHYLQRESSVSHIISYKCMLDSCNEISLFIYQNILKNNFIDECIDYYPIMHFFIISNQYSKMLENGHITELSDEIKKIKNSEWFYNQNILLAKNNYKEASKYFRGKDLCKIKILNDYALNENYHQFRFYRKIYNLFFYKNKF